MSINTLIINPLEHLSNFKIKLTVPMVTGLLLSGKKQVEISRMCNVTESWVSEFIQRHYDEIYAVIDPTDRFMALKSKTVASRALDKIDKILTSEVFDKRHLVSLNITAGTQIDKYRLLAGKSTENVSIDAVISSRADLNKRRESLRVQIAQAKGVSSDSGE